MNFGGLNTISLLIIEDIAEESRAISKQILESIRSYFENIYISNGFREAINIYEANKDDIDIVILDTNSYKKLDEFKNFSGFDERVLFLAFLHYGDEGLMKKLIELDIDSFMMKPVEDRDKLLIKLNKMAENIFSKLNLEKKREILDKHFIYSETDTRGIITYVSEPFIELSGYTREELLGRSHNIIRHKDVDASLFKELWSVVKSGKTWIGEVKNQKKDGSYYVVKSVVMPIFYKKKIVGYCSARVDMTQVYERSKELHLHSKYKAMSEMLSMVSHHWRQPIASIGLEVDNALFDITMGEIDEESITTSLKSINKKVQHLSNILNIFKGFIDKNPKELISIDLLIQKIVFVMRGALDYSSISITTNALKKERSIFTFKSELINVLVNIIINAKENIVKNSILNGSVEIRCEVFGEYLQIKIRDNGGGIDASVIDNLFEPYISTKEAKNGTGLGLYIVKELVEKKLDGSVSAKNLCGGAEFTLKIRGVINDERDNC